MSPVVGSSLTLSHRINQRESRRRSLGGSGSSFYCYRREKAGIAEECFHHLWEKAQSFYIQMQRDVFCGRRSRMTQTVMVGGWDGEEKWRFDRQQYQKLPEKIVLKKEPLFRPKNRW